MGFYKSFKIANILTNLFSSKNLAKIILFGVILLFIGLLFSNNVLATDEYVDNSIYEDVELIQINGLNINGNTQKITQSNANLYYFESFDNYFYKITNNGATAHSFYVSDKAPSVGDSVTFLVTLQSGESYYFVGNDNFYVFSYNSTSLASVSRKPFGSYMDITSNKLADTLSAKNLWNQIGFVIPLIAVAVLLAIGFIIVRKLSNGTSKGKVKF